MDLQGRGGEELRLRRPALPAGGKQTGAAGGKEEPGSGHCLRPRGRPRTWMRNLPLPPVLLGLQGIVQLTIIDTRTVLSRVVGHTHLHLPCTLPTRAVVGHEVDVVHPAIARAGALRP
jgi:hypothetical protein